MEYGPVRFELCIDGLEERDKDGTLIIKSFDGMYSILHGRIVYWFIKDYYLLIKCGS